MLRRPGLSGFRSVPALAVAAAVAMCGATVVPVGPASAVGKEPFASVVGNSPARTADSKITSYLDVRDIAPQGFQDYGTIVTVSGTLQGPSVPSRVSIQQRQFQTTKWVEVASAITSSDEFDEYPPELGWATATYSAQFRRRVCADIRVVYAGSATVAPDVAEGPGGVLSVATLSGWATRGSSKRNKTTSITVKTVPGAGRKIILKYMPPKSTKWVRNAYIAKTNGSGVATVKFRPTVKGTYKLRLYVWREKGILDRTSAIRLQRVN
ncbi:hypothetical protein EV385_6677 [Krasilnikovia cinnamomea]|uniref:Surface-anchored protein n=1 Tax=Krasilnikovia cinnamomea TaxID=349313 RepID=A0A4Q7Z7W0_9ACTN|nr:hypothetical protein [Krasilnikovia cinnamomea]RZU46602.1 hypothetical protein EV385_6677 [Krasilnikovia cinnamomea]